MARVNYCPRTRGGEPRNRSSRASQLACIIARACHCLQIWEGGQAIVACAYHISRASQLARIISRKLGGGGQAVMAHVLHGSRASRLARIVACTLGRGGPGNHSLHHGPAPLVEKDRCNPATYGSQESRFPEYRVARISRKRKSRLSDFRGDSELPPPEIGNWILFRGNPVFSISGVVVNNRNFF